MLLALPLLVCIIGLLIYMLAEKAKVAEVGKIMFWTGLLVTLAQGGVVVSKYLQ